jgi:prepilin-type N-terminal cleavage/methylation domain-containing protein
MSRTRPCRPSRRLPHRSLSGYTLVELALALVVAGILAALAAPRFAAMADALAVDAAVRRVTALHQAARMQAVLHSRTAVYSIATDTLRIALVRAGDTTRAATALGPAADGVTLAGPAHPIVWSPVGITTGLSNGTWRFVRGAVERDVIVSRLGRLRVVRP